MGHTASVAGDYRVFADLLRDAGALVAETFEDFMRSGAALRHAGRARVYAGGGWRCSPTRATRRWAWPTGWTGSSRRPFRRRPCARIEAALTAARIDRLVDAKNPLDLTPMAGDGVHADCIEALLGDEGVDLGLFGNVPLTSQVQSLPRGISEHDVFDAAGGYAERVIDALCAEHQALRGGDRRRPLLRRPGRPPAGRRRAGLPQRRPGHAAAGALRGASAPRRRGYVTPITAGSRPFTAQRKDALLCLFC